MDIPRAEGSKAFPLQAAILRASAPEPTRTAQPQFRENHRLSRTSENVNNHQKRERCISSPRAFFCSPRDLFQLAASVSSSQEVC